MPPVSEAQRRWAFANRDKPGKEGKAAREFADADTGGKLPAHAPKRRNKPESLFRVEGHADGGEVQQPAQPDSIWRKIPGVSQWLAVKDTLDRAARQGAPKPKDQTPPNHAAGGPVRRVVGPRVGRDDGLIAAQKGEFVVRKEAVKKLGLPAMREINQGRLPRGKKASLFDYPRSRA